MKSSEIRESFLAFFESKGCTRWPSSSLIPDDPSLLLTTAGMVQFKPVFLGLKSLGFTRATTCQKCVRTTDIDIIGTTGRHHSFFEMLGNFSFGDYFKKEACTWAQEYSTRVLGMDPDRLWYSIYTDDDEAFEVWTEVVGVPAERVVRLGEKDNFWSAGPTGPCGPCSELYYDQGSEVGCGKPDCAPGCDCDRYLEYWNLVFMQFDRQEDGTLQPLPKKNIDTGLGLERVAAIMQKAPGNFETDVLSSILDLAQSITGVAYKASERSDVSLRILADHARAVSFMIADGILPSNEGRGYVLRRLLRRAVRHGRLLGVERPFLGELIDEVVAQSGGHYGELVEHQAFMKRIVASEEARFGSTLKQGLGVLESELAKAKQADAQVFDGKTTFVLHDTYGFPVELTSEIVREAGLAVDMTEFEAEMEAQRQRARAAVKDESWMRLAGDLAPALAGQEGVEFVGYEVDESGSRILAILLEGSSVDSIDEGETAEVVLDKTPFYGEQGGQVGDTGWITSSNGARFEVSAATLPAADVTVHMGVLRAGSLGVGEKVHAAIDVPRRERTRRNHTATHLLQWALRLVLGEHVRQSGSLVSPDRLRFDFTHFEAMTPEQLAKVARLVNAKIMENHPVRAYETSLTSAREAGVTALFGEKYGDFVRVLEVGNFSKELCGGTHVGRTTEIGSIKVLSEGSVGANLRRIEAVTSFDAMNAVYAEEEILKLAAEALKCRPSEVADRAQTVARRLKDAETSLKSAKRQGPGADVDSLLGQAVDVGYPLVVAKVDTDDAGSLRELADRVRGRLTGGAVVFAAASDGKALLLAAGSEPAVKAGFDAGAVIKAMTPSVKGGGGGKASMAQAGGKDPSGIDEALAVARRVLGAG